VQFHQYFIPFCSGIVASRLCERDTIDESGKCYSLDPSVWPLPHRAGSPGSPSVRGGPRLNGRSFGLCWNSGQNDLHIEFQVLLLSRDCCVACSERAARDLAAPDWDRGRAFLICTNYANHANHRKPRFKEIPILLENPWKSQVYYGNPLSLVLERLRRFAWFAMISAF
jgi:hypothetical protein